MAGESEEIGMRTVGTYVLSAVQCPAWPELGFGAGLAPADEGKNAGVRLKVGEAGGGGGGGPGVRCAGSRCGRERLLWFRTLIWGRRAPNGFGKPSSTAALLLISN